MGQSAAKLFILSKHGVIMSTYTNRSIGFTNRNKSYIAHIAGKSFSYAIGRYKQYAEVLAKMSASTGIRYENYFENYPDNTTVFYIPTKTYGIQTVVMDTIDASKFYSSRISISKDNHAHTFYAKTKNGPVHRIIVNATDSNQIVDHINRNGLDNTRKNLRIVSYSINNRNTHIRKDNTSGLKCICEEENRFRVFYYNHQMQKCSKSFSKYKYGIEQARQMAINFRNEMYDLYNYMA